MLPFLSKEEHAHMDDEWHVMSILLQSTENAPGLEENVGNSE